MSVLGPVQPSSIPNPVTNIPDIQPRANAVLPHQPSSISTSPPKNVFIRFISWIASSLANFINFICRCFYPSTQRPQQAPTASPISNPAPVAISVPIPAVVQTPRVPLRYTSPQLADIWRETLEVLQRGEYCSPNGTVRRFQNEMTNAIQNSILYQSAGPHLTPSANPIATDLVVINRDCLEEGLQLKERGFNPIVLNMANEQVPGGGYLRGAAAQEEDCCRRSALAAALDRAAGFQTRNFYPIPNEGGLYTPTVPILRASGQHNYAYLDQPANIAYTLAFATVAAIYLPNTTAATTLTPEQERLTKEKMRTQFKMALDNGHDALVLSAFGCGAFGNPPEVIARLYMDVYRSEFAGRFRYVSFAIIDDHNAGRAHNPRGNFTPFAEIISLSGGRIIR